MHVTWEYMDGRLPRDRTVQTSPAKLHLLLIDGHPVTPVDEENREVYIGWCQGEGHEPCEASVPTKWGPYDTKYREVEPADESAVEVEERESEPEEADAAEAPEEAAEPPEEAEEDDDDVRDDFPDGYTFGQRRAFFDVVAPDGTEIGTFKGRALAIVKSWEHYDLSAESAADEDTE